ncbi:MAG TPA: RNase adapter RapZ [Candidatus Avimonoglobus intestinipullorum]|uniref:RNase adapter RapZ n=1 Tax=Candidatus Avimonoglobus intestinipullorum TaxID=2840699 RepID=A0A9D1LVR7_9FIRM|nr:RNase adapter RapZ [Candidatus Avimonoglobus intestinipullorum]
MQLTVVTGMSGSGKTQVVRFLEDMGFFCIDNMPPILIEKFADMFFSVNGKYDKIAFVIDVRVGEMINQLLDTLQILKENGYDHRLLFLDASDETLVKRYKETRRIHPVASDKGLLESIRRERQMLAQLKEAADVVIDTTDMAISDLMQRLKEIYIHNGDPQKAITVNIMAFGFKYGIPLDSDLVFDVRCFPNPFYVEELKDKTGNDREVQEYVMKFEETQKFLEKLVDMVRFLLPLYVEEGKTSLTVSIGCTGGKHRSVTLANKLGEALEHYHVNLIYRDVARGR